MQVEYNGYLCQFGGTNLRITKHTQISQLGKDAIRIWNIYIRGYIRTDQNPPFADLTAKMQALETAFSQSGGDFRLLNSGQETAHKLLSADTISGVHALRFEWLTGNPPAAEYVNRRSWAAQLQAEERLADGTLFYTESVRVTYPGAVDLWQPALFTAPQKQTVQAIGSQIAIQRGHSVGIATYPPFPPKLFPLANMKIKQSWDEHLSPRRLGNQPSEWPISWFWVFEGVGFSPVPPNYPLG
jgi:hypothetical protein